MHWMLKKGNGKNDDVYYFLSNKRVNISFHWGGKEKTRGRLHYNNTLWEASIEWFALSSLYLLN